MLELLTAATIYCVDTDKAANLLYSEYKETLVREQPLSNGNKAELYKNYNTNSWTILVVDTDSSQSCLLMSSTDTSMVHYK